MAGRFQDGAGRLHLPRHLERRRARALDHMARPVFLYAMHAFKRTIKISSEPLEPSSCRAAPRRS